jgi:hypothetical protein
MEAKFEPSAPDAIEMKMEITMRLGEWKKLQAAVETKGNWPALEFHGKVRDLIYQAEKHFYPKAEPA